MSELVSRQYGLIFSAEKGEIVVMEEDGEPDGEINIEGKQMKRVYIWVV